MAGWMQRQSITADDNALSPMREVLAVIAVPVGKNRTKRWCMMTLEQAAMIVAELMPSMRERCYCVIEERPKVKHL